MKIINLAPFEKRIRNAVDQQLTKLLKNDSILCDHKLNLAIDLSKAVRSRSRPKVKFTSRAYMQLQALVQCSSKEIAAHGVVTHNKNVYIIEELIMYPQEVTGATVQATDDYGPWLMTLPDETFNNLRFQVHSHVNMGTSPSGVDTALYETMMKDVKDYYIFMIMNKRSEFNIYIYDVTKNCIFETSDIDVSYLINEKQSVEYWYQTQTKEFIKEKKFQSGVSSYNGSFKGRQQTFFDDKRNGSAVDDVPTKDEDDWFESAYYRQRFQDDVDRDIPR